MRNSRRRRITAVLAVIGLVTVAFFATVSTAADPTVSISGTAPSNYSFAPATLNVSAGTKVKWNWSSNAPHNVAFKKLDEKSATSRNGSFHLKFKKPGTYKYLCTVHGFRGKVIVG